MDMALASLCGSIALSLETYCTYVLLNRSAIDFMCLLFFVVLWLGTFLLFVASLNWKLVYSDEGFLFRSVFRHTTTNITKEPLQPTVYHSVRRSKRLSFISSFYPFHRTDRNRYCFLLVHSNHIYHIAVRVFNFNAFFRLDAFHTLILE